MKSFFKTLKVNLLNINLWRWLIISLTVLYVFFTIIIDFSDWMIWSFSILIFPLCIGLGVIYKESRHKPLSLSINLIDIPMAAIGLVLTVLLSHVLDLSPVIASSMVGILAYISLKKYAVVIFCGSFAGMISADLLIGFDLIWLALICGMVVGLLKSSFDGIGRKLGTMAFISTFLFAIITGKDFLLIENDLSFVRLLIISFMGTFISFYLQHQFKQSAVIASALPSLIFALVMIYGFKDYGACALVFFSASFIGMSSKKRISGFYQLLMAGFVHACMFYIYFEHYHGLGGKLGLMALSSVLISMGIYRVYETLMKTVEKERL